MYFKRIFFIIFSAVMILSAESCSRNEEPIHVCVLKGPTGMGIVHMMESSKALAGKNIEYTILDDPQLLTAELIKGNVDIAALPANVGAMLFNKGLDIKVIAVNTLGSIYILTRDSSFSSLKQLKGKTLFISGQGATPDIIAEYLTDRLKIKNASFNYKFSSHSDLASALIAGYAEYALLPEPFVSSVISADSSIRVVVGFDSIFETISGFSIPMGCLVATGTFLKNRDAAEEFLREYEKSVNSIYEDRKGSAELILKYGILNNVNVAYEAIPRSKIVFIRGKACEEILMRYYDIIFPFNPDAIGGILPDSSFYFR